MKQVKLFLCGVMCIAALTAAPCQGGVATIVMPTGFSIPLNKPQDLVLNDAQSIHLESQTINAVTQDLCWYAMHGSDLSNATEDERISTHLKYVRVLLERKDTKRLSKKASANRKYMLSVLKNYTLSSMFPTNVNESFESRTPIFIDQYGVSCAVAHMILNSEDEKYVNGMVALNEKFPTAYLMDVFSGDYGEEAKKLVLEWANVHGFEPVELAMIQPTYRHMPPYLPPRDPPYTPPYTPPYRPSNPYRTIYDTDVCVSETMKKIICPAKKRGCQLASRRVYICKKGRSRDTLDDELFIRNDYYEPYRL